jgi:ribosomal-protein-alanine N-acetyltransferase
VTSGRVHLERPSLSREAAYLSAARASRKLHRGFVTTSATTQEYRDYLRRSRRRNQESFFVTANDTNELAGVVNVNEIVRYSLNSAYLGYYAFVPYAGCGLMKEGMALVLKFSFRDLRLHRLEANIQQANRRSIELVRGLGFRFEGVAQRYLKIGGRWRDHERWALTAEEWRAGASRSVAAPARVG